MTKAETVIICEHKVLTFKPNATNEEMKKAYEAICKEQGI